MNEFGNRTLFRIIIFLILVIPIAYLVWLSRNSFIINLPF